MDEIKVENGKYAFSISNDGEVCCLRFGERWVTFDKGSKALIALLSRIKELEDELNKYKDTFDFWICSWCGEKFKKSDGIDSPAYHTIECKKNPLVSRVKGLEDKIELAEATRDDALAYARMYMGRVEELEEGIEKHKRYGEHWSIDEELYELIEKP